jgi:hypothetical protein
MNMTSNSLLEWEESACVGNKGVGVVLAVAGSLLAAR